MEIYLINLYFTYLLDFFLADVTPPKVRRSKKKKDSDIARLSFRDLFWYCYLTQEELDSAKKSLSYTIYYTNKRRLAGCYRLDFILV